MVAIAPPGLIREMRSPAQGFADEVWPHRKNTVWSPLSRVSACRPRCRWNARKYMPSSDPKKSRIASDRPSIYDVEPALSGTSEGAFLQQPALR